MRKIITAIVALSIAAGAANAAPPRHAHHAHRNLEAVRYALLRSVGR